MINFKAKKGLCTLPYLNSFPPEKSCSDLWTHKKYKLKHVLNLLHFRIIVFQKMMDSLLKTDY